MVTLYHSLGANGLIAAVRSEAGTRRQVLLHTAVHPRAEVQLHVEPVEWRKLHNEQLHSLYSSPNIVRLIEMGSSCSQNGRG